MNAPSRPVATTRAKSLRNTQTKSEGLLWSVLRAKQLCGLKFRRQHPIGPWFADFACPTQMLVVEIDGGYHEALADQDDRREEHLRLLGWTVIRFTDEAVEQDAEAVARAIAKEVNLPYVYKKRNGTGAGMNSVNAARKSAKQPSPR